VANRVRPRDQDEGAVNVFTVPHGLSPAVPTHRWTPPTPQCTASRSAVNRGSAFPARAVAFPCARPICRGRQGGGVLLQHNDLKSAWYKRRRNNRRPIQGGRLAGGHADEICLSPLTTPAPGRGQPFMRTAPTACATHGPFSIHGLQTRGADRWGRSTASCLLV